MNRTVHVRCQDGSSIETLLVRFLLSEIVVSVHLIYACQSILSFLGWSHVRMEVEE